PLTLSHVVTTSDRYADHAWLVVMGDVRHVRQADQDHVLRVDFEVDIVRRGMIYHLLETSLEVREGFPLDGKLVIEPVELRIVVPFEVSVDILKVQGRERDSLAL